jgi:DNA primase small subunit
LKYAAGAEVPKSQFVNSEVSNQSFNFEHFSIPIGYQKIFTDRVKFNIQHLVGNEKLDGINPKLMKDIMAARHHLEGDNWGQFKNDIGPRRYRNLVNAMARVNLATIDAKVSIDLKRILRLPSSLHSKVSMKCMEVKNRETFDPFDKAVPKFVYERKGV